MIRLILFILIVYFFFRLVGRMLRVLIKVRTVPPQQTKASPPPRSTGPQVIDEMKPCPSCGTFNPARLALQKKDLYFCDERCHEAHIKRSPPHENLHRHG